MASCGYECKVCSVAWKSKKANFILIFLSMYNEDFSIILWVHHHVGIGKTGTLHLIHYRVLHQIKSTLLLWDSVCVLVRTVYPSCICAMALHPLYMSVYLHCLLWSKSLFFCQFVCFLFLLSPLHSPLTHTPLQVSLKTSLYKWPQGQATLSISTFSWTSLAPWAMT